MSRASLKSPDPLVRLTALRTMFLKAKRYGPPTRRYTVEFEEFAEVAANGQEIREVYKTTVVKAKTARDAFLGALKGYRHLSKRKSKIVVVYVKPVTGTDTVDAARDFGNFHAFRSVTDNKWSVKKGYPEDHENALAGYDDDVGSSGAVQTHLRPKAEAVNKVNRPVGARRK